MELKKPDRMLVYYGYLNSYNSAVHSWSNEKVAQELSYLKILILGNGIEDFGHVDYANTVVILARLKELNPSMKIIGYASANQSYKDFSGKVMGWHVLDVNGIMLDEAGYDYGVKRHELNHKVKLAHDLGMFAMVNAWKIEHVLSHDPADDDSSYLNSTYNPDLEETALAADDYYMLESHAIDSSGAYEPHAQWNDRAQAAKLYDINLAAVSVISDTDQNGQAKYDYCYLSALAWGLDAVSTSNSSYGSGGASKLWSRPDVSRLREEGINPVEKDASLDVYYRYLDGGRIKIDHRSASQSASIEID